MTLICSRCRLEIHPADTREYRGHHATHEPARCVYLLRDHIAHLKATICPEAASARRKALEEAARLAWTEAAHGLEPDEVIGGSYYAGWDDGVAIYCDAIHALIEKDGA